MSARKTIQINPDFFKLSGKGKTRRKKEKREKRKDLRMSIKPNNIKKKLMAKIKEHQKQKADENITTLSLKKDEEAQEKFTKDFNKQIDYLEKIIGNKKEKERKKKNINFDIIYENIYSTTVWLFKKWNKAYLFSI